MLIREEGNQINQEEDALEEILYGLLREQGIWAVLFVALLCYVLRKNEEQDKQEAAREAAPRAVKTICGGTACTARRKGEEEHSEQKIRNGVAFFACPGFFSYEFANSER